MNLNDVLIAINVFIIVGYLVYRFYLKQKKVIKTRKEKTHEI